MNEQQNELLEKETPKKYKYLPNTNKSDEHIQERVPHQEEAEKN